MHDESIEHQLAIAMVRGGLSYRSFSLLTLAEWEAVAAEITHEQDDTLRTGWEQTRQLIYAALAPHLKEGTTIRSLVPLPWDKDTTDTDNETTSTSSELPSKEEIQGMLQRFGSTSLT